MRSYRLPLLFAALLAVAALAGSFIAGPPRTSAPASGPRAGTGGGDGALREPDAGPLPDERVRVEVLNATSRSGLARKVTQHLRDAGFDVVYFGNAPHADSSVVLDRAERPEAARAVAAALGVARVRSRPDPGLYLDATVILGKDWPPREEGAEGWWERLTSRWRRP